MRTSGGGSGGFPACSKWALVIVVAVVTLSDISTATRPRLSHAPRTQQPVLHRLLEWRSSWRIPDRQEPPLDARAAMAAALCLVAAAISSAGGLGGGSLFLPVLSLVAGMELKVATPFSAFMVTGAAAANVLYNMCSSAAFIDYDVALLSEPGMLLGVTAGVVCNVVFPGWLVTLLFALVLAWSTFKTCRAGARCWREETHKSSLVDVQDQGLGDKGALKGVEEPLLGGDEGRGGEGPKLKKMVVLVMIWVCFFFLQLLRGDKKGTGVIRLARCGLGYWLITLSQAPLALLLTWYILYKKGVQQEQQMGQEDSSKVPVAQARYQALPNVIFPVAALLSGVLGGLFGIGGGLLINPVLLQIGLPPQITAATCCFMVLFSSSMSSFQYLMLGMEGITRAVIMAMGCSVASLTGLIIIQRAVGKYGRASLIIFSVSTVMVLSTVSITCFGVIDVWRDYLDGKDMGFKLPC